MYFVDFYFWYQFCWDKLEDDDLCQVRRDTIDSNRRARLCTVQAPDQPGRGAVLEAGAAGRAADQGEAARGEAVSWRPGPAQVETASREDWQSIIIMDRLVKQPSESRGGVMQILHKVDI